MRLQINSFWVCWTGMGQRVAQLHDGGDDDDRFSSVLILDSS